MIISNYQEQLFLVTQAEHSEFVGQIAAQWGNADFAKPEPYQSMVILASEHDHAWVIEDNQPSFNEALKRPHDYVTLPYGLHTAIYQKGTRDTVMNDSYAGYLLSMHGMGIYNERYGTDPGQVRPINSLEDFDTVEKYKEDETNFQEKMRNHLELMEDSCAYMSQEHVWKNYLLMQVWDRLGLLLCKRQESDFTLEPVPLGYVDDASTQIKVTWVGENVFTMDPYPFAKDVVSFYYKGRFIPDRDYTDQDDYHSVYYQSEREPVCYTFKLPD